MTYAEGFSPELKLYIPKKTPYKRGSGKHPVISANTRLSLLYDIPLDFSPRGEKRGEEHELCVALSPQKTCCLDCPFRTSNCKLQASLTMPMPGTGPRAPVY